MTYDELKSLIKDSTVEQVLSSYYCVNSQSELFEAMYNLNEETLKVWAEKVNIDPINLFSLIESKLNCKADICIVNKNVTNLNLDGINIELSWFIDE